MSEAEAASIWTHYEEYIENLQLHSIWGIKSAARNRTPAFREVVELVPIDPYCWEKLQESLDPDAWPTLQALFSKDPWPEPDSEKRRQNRQMWAYRDLLSRLSEMRGYLSQKSIGETEVLVDLLRLAEQVAGAICADDPLNRTADEHGQELASVRQKVCDVLHRVSDEEVRRPMLMMIENPFTHLMEPR